MKKLVLIFLLVSCSGKEISEVYVEDGIAINGYDPVAYFTESKPIPGSDEFTFQWNSATWKFSTHENMEAFKAQPEKFSPVFGGYCAYGMSNGEGYKATTVPQAWTILDDKLYLNYNLKVKDKWLENQQERINEAWGNWPRVKNDVEVKR